MLILRILLIPVSLIYSALMYIRNALFDAGLIKSHSVSKPVISVGNITAGGSGKTPFVILTAVYYLSKGKKVGIISRGYKRKSKETVLVSDGRTINENTKESGDELVQISDELMRNFRGSFFIAADGDRLKAAEYLISRFDPDIIILDDGYQHRRIKRDLDIVLVDSHSFKRNRFLHTFTFPSGILREGLDNLKRAGLIIQNNKNEDCQLIPELKKYSSEIFFMRYKSEYFMDYKNSILNSDNIKAVVFSGIADDDSFIQMIKNNGINIRETLTFSDHHNYTEADLKFLENRYSDGIKFITTEKDFVKIRSFTGFIKKYPVYYLKITAEIEDGSNLLFKKLDELVI